MDLTIVVPVYNAAAYLPACLEQLQNQGFAAGACEIVLVDDGSVDDSPRLCDEYARTIDCVRAVHQGENRGAGAARNRGIEEARGDYLYFFDADDAIEPGSLARLVERMKTDDLDVLFFGARVVYESERAEALHPQDADYFRRITQPGILNGKAMFEHQVRAGDFCAQPCVQICKTSYVREGGVRFAEGMVNEDNEFVIRSMTADGRCAMVPDTCYGYLVREGSVTTDQSKGLARLRAHMYLSDFCRARAYAARDAGEDGLCEAFSMLDEWFVDCAVEACDSMVDGFPSTPLWPDNVMAAADQRECYWRLWQRQNIIRIQEGSIADLDAKLSATRAELDESRRETVAKIEELDAAYAEIEALRSSVSFKVGRAITALPRAVKRALGR